MKHHTIIPDFRLSHVDLSGLTLSMEEIKNIKHLLNKGYSYEVEDIMPSVFCVTTVAVLVALIASIAGDAPFALFVSLFIAIPFVIFNIFNRYRLKKLDKVFTVNAVGMYTAVQNNDLDKYHTMVEKYIMSGDGIPKSMRMYDGSTYNKLYSRVYHDMVYDVCGYTYQDGTYDTVKKFKEIAPTTFKKWHLVLAAHAKGAFARNCSPEEYGQYKSFYEMVDEISKLK